LVGVKRFVLSLLWLLVFASNGGSAGSCPGGRPRREPCSRLPTALFVALCAAGTGIAESHTAIAESGERGHSRNARQGIRRGLLEVNSRSTSWGSQ